MERKKENYLCPQMTLPYVYKTLKIPHKKILLEPINEPSNVAEYKIDTQKSVLFLYTNNNLRRILRKQFHLQ